MQRLGECSGPRTVGAPGWDQRQGRAPPGGGGNEHRYRYGRVCVHTSMSFLVSDRIFTHPSSPTSHTFRPTTFGLVALARITLCACNLNL